MNRQRVDDRYLNPLAGKGMSDLPNKNMPGRMQIAGISESDDGERLYSHDFTVDAAGVISLTEKRKLSDVCVSAFA